MLKVRLNKTDDDITFAQLRLEIEKRDEIISQLRTEMHTLKGELTQVKERNKKLYQILSHGESKHYVSTKYITILMHQRCVALVICQSFSFSEG